MKESARGAGGDGEKLPELMSDLADMVAQELVQAAGVEEQRARAIGQTVIERWVELYGGRQFYITKAASLLAQRRWKLLATKFNGHNQAELAVEFGMNVKQIYRVLKIMRERERERRRTKINPEGETN